MAIVFVWPMHAIGASGGRPYSTVAQEMTGDTADDRTFNAAARPSLGWYGENDGRKTAQQ